MRVRRKPGSYEALQAIDAYFIETPESYKGRWSEAFGNDRPIHSEFGGGKGRFIVGMAKLHPEINYIMVDVVPEIALKAAQLMEAEGLTNVKLILMDLANLEEVFEAEELDRIYLNFSDPWPKRRHHRRRLTYRRFLERYARVLKSDGWVHFKTDNRRLFEFSLNELAECDWVMRSISLDLHHNLTIENVMTEYEEKFVNLGQPIYRLEATFRT